MSSSAVSADARLRILCGPTAAGKSALALQLAERAPVTIICADSRQIYRGFDIGTAKPTPDERARVPHRGLDLVEPEERFSAAAWAEQARAWISEAHAAGRVPLVVAGTGLYVRALTAPLFAEPELDPLRRERLRRMLAGFPRTELRRWGEALDPARAHLGPVQLARSIEVALLAGRRLSTLHAGGPGASPVRARYLVIDPGGALATRIAARVDAMLAAGWLEETRRLVERVPADAPAWSSTGYGLLGDVVRGTRSLAEARERVIIETRRYAKRQRTWWRHQVGDAPVLRVDPLAPGAWREIERWWTQEERE